VAARARGACFKAARNCSINQKYASNGSKFKDEGGLDKGDRVDEFSQSGSLVVVFSVQPKSPVDLKTTGPPPIKETPLRKRRVTL
jgi:hypothetical protein